MKKMLTRRETVKCAFCGTLCKWVEHEDKWRMVELDNSFHLCHPGNPKKLDIETKQMQIQILSIQVAPATTKAGKPYEVLDIAFKNNTFQGKVEGKKLMPFGANAGAFNTLKNATPGQTYEIAVVKNDAGYNDWTAATLSDAVVGTPAGNNPNGSAAKPATGAPGTGGGANSRGFPTPEERAATQVYIVRQSSISNAVATLSAGAKSAIDPAKVVETAKIYEAYVLDIAQEPAADFSDMHSDVPL